MEGWGFPGLSPVARDPAKRSGVCWVSIQEETRKASCGLPRAGKLVATP
jgi:hypothetical protein